MKSLLFVIAGANQWSTALDVAAGTQTQTETFVLDLNSMNLTPAPRPGTSYTGQHWPSQGFSDMARLTGVLDDAFAQGVGAIVLGQDVARPQRVAVRAAKKRGVKVAIVPDGGLFISPPDIKSNKIRIQEYLMWAMRRTQCLPRTWGGTRPDLWCAWGRGWVPLMNGFSPSAGVAVTGNPRSEDLLSVTPVTSDRILICSQPTDTSPFPNDAAAPQRWYEWIERMVATAGEDQVRVRLHPREWNTIDHLPLGPHTKGALSENRTLAEDLTDCGGVIAALSTVLFEAAAAGRQVASITPTPGARRARLDSPATRDSRLLSKICHEIQTFEVLQGDMRAVDAQTVSEWGSDFSLLQAGAPGLIAQTIEERLLDQ